MAEPGRDFRQRLRFDEAAGRILDEGRRYLLMRPDALMGMFRRLPEPERLQALAALADSIAERGSDSAHAYRALGGAEGERLADTIAATAPQLGWGIWRFELAADVIALEVRDSPFAAGFGPSGHPVCHAVAGMLRAVASMMLGGAAEARETRCAAEAAPEAAPCCRFEARRAERA